MKTARVTKWGNSAGIRISAETIKSTHIHIGDELLISISKNGNIILTPTKNPQQEWLEAFNAAADAGEDKMLLNDIESEFDRDEWTW